MAVVNEAQGYGRRGRTSRAEMVAAALTIADRNGIDALTIRRLAGECGLSAMGVYRYVRDRSELLDLIVEAVLEELPDTPLRGPWRTRATRLFSGFREMALAHPNVAALGVARATPVPAMARFTDRALGVLEEAGLHGKAAVLAYDALLMFTIGSTLWQIPRTGTERSQLISAALVDGSHVPHLVQHAAHLAPRDPDRYFSHGLNLLLDGIETKANR